eukprot:Phypoly_transcript_07689.p1 GENE.Phypoly_transcript_07689~~Phypoly_transcript_07689.p1  ORF type:complete len:440 (+),score=136.57 Phypoly_transcript_07689:57-1376(+)
MTANSNNLEDALNNLTNLFPNVDRAFLEDVYVSSKKDFDNTVDTLLSMGIDMDVDKTAKKPTPVQPTPFQPTPTPVKPQQQTNVNTPPPSYPTLTASYPTPGSPHAPHPSAHHLPPLNPNVPPSTTLPSLQTVLTATPMDSYPPRNIHQMYTTPPPIISPTPVVTSPTPTAPPATNLNSSQVDQKRMETMKQELALEYQRIAEKHKYNLELQQKLEQLSEFTSTEQKKLEEQRALLAEEKRKFTEELNTRFKALEDDYQRQRDELLRQEEQRAAAAREQEEAKAQAKEERRRLKALQKEEGERQRSEADVERIQQVESLTRRLEEAQENLESVLKEKNEQIERMRDNSDAEIEALKERIRNLERQLRKTEYEVSEEVLSYFSTVVSTLASGIHAVSIERANAAGENGEMPENAEPLRDLKRTFFKTINEQFSNKLREQE